MKVGDAKTLRRTSIMQELLCWLHKFPPPLPLHFSVYSRSYWCYRPECVGVRGRETWDSTITTYAASAGRYIYVIIFNIFHFLIKHHFVCLFVFIIIVLFFCPKTLLRMSPLSKIALDSQSTRAHSSTNSKSRNSATGTHKEHEVGEAEARS